MHRDAMDGRVDSADDCLHAMKSCFACFCLLLSIVIADEARAAGAGMPWGVAVIPKSAPLGVARTIVVTGICPGKATIDDAALAAESVTVNLAADGASCQNDPVPTRLVAYTPRHTGRAKASVSIGGGPAMEAEFETTAGARPHGATDLSGMWYHPAASGTGISFNHNLSTDAVSGTWFMYAGLSRWFSLQGLQWVEDGSVLEGYALEVSANGPPCLPSARACTRTAGAASFRARVRVTILDEDSARIEAFDITGSSIMTSDLIRLVY